MRRAFADSSLIRALRAALPVIFALGFAAATPEHCRASLVYWNVFNIEGESDLSGSIVTYATLADMLTDTNRTGHFDPVGAFGDNLVGSGATTRPQSVPVPEPSTLSLCTVALGALIGYARRKRTWQAQGRCPS